MVERHLNIGVYGSRGIPSTYSGYETFLTFLLPELARRGHAVTIYCRHGAVPEGPEYEGVTKRFLRSLQTKELGTLTHGALSAVAARFRNHDVVLVVNPANALFCWGATRTGQAVVLNTDGQEWLRGKWGPLGRRAFRFFASIAGRASTALISDSVAMAHVYRDEFGAESTVIPYCWTDLTTVGGESRLAQLGLEEGAFACCAGRLIPENNAVPLARAYLESGAHWPLVVLGTANYDSPVQRELSALARGDDRLRLIGHVADRSEYAALVRGAGLYFHTHSVGGINPSLVEAMGLGASILALDTPFNREALGEHGRYFGRFDDALIKEIERIVAEPQRPPSPCVSPHKSEPGQSFGLTTLPMRSRRCSPSRPPNDRAARLPSTLDGHQRSDCGSSLAQKWKVQPMIWDKARAVYAAQKGLDPEVLRDWRARELFTATSTIGQRLIRGQFLRARMGHTQGPVLCERGVRITHASHIDAGRRLNLEDGCEIVGLSRRGIVFGNRCTVGRLATVRPTNVLLDEPGEGLFMGDNSNIGAYSFIGCSGFIEHREQRDDGASRDSSRRNPQSLRTPTVQSRRKGSLAAAFIITTTVGSAQARKCCLE